MTKVADGGKGNTGTADTTGKTGDVKVPEGTGNSNTLTTGTETTDHKAGNTGQGGDEKTTGDGTGTTAETTGKAGDAQTPKAPEKYDLKLPDTAKGLIADSDLKRLETLARQADLSNEDAQAWLDEHIGVITLQSNEYFELAKKDPEIGGDKLPVTEQLATRAIDRIRPENHPRREAFMGLLTRGGINRHPEVLAFLADIGKMMGEDKVIGGRASGGAEKTVAEVLYGG